LAIFGNKFSKILGTTILLKLEIYLLKTEESDKINISGTIIFLDSIT
jgi:hypothetical protein